MEIDCSNQHITLGLNIGQILFWSINSKTTGSPFLASYRVQFECSLGAVNLDGMVIKYFLDCCTPIYSGFIKVLAPYIGVGHNGLLHLLPSGEGVFNPIIIFVEFELSGKHVIIQ
jgi:hypothetical protein